MSLNSVIKRALTCSSSAEFMFRPLGLTERKLAKIIEGSGGRVLFRLVTPPLLRVRRLSVLSPFLSLSVTFTPQWGTAD